MSKFNAVFEIDSPNKVPYDEWDVTIHNISHGGVDFQMIETKDGRYDISGLIKSYGIKYEHIQKSKEVEWIEISELIQAPAVIKYQYKEKARPRVLFCIPESLLCSITQYKKFPPDIMLTIAKHISELYKRPIKQIDELKFKVLANEDMSVIISMSEHKEGWCNMGPLVMSARKVKGKHGTVTDFITNKSTMEDIDNVIAEYFPEHIYDSHPEKLKLVYQKKYGIEWMHEDLAIAFAMWISSKFRTQVYKLVKRITSGDFTVIPDIIQSIDQVNNTKTLAQFWTYEEALIESNVDVKVDYERRLRDLEATVEQYRLMHQQSQLQLTDTKTALQTFQMVVSVPEKTMKRALKIANGPRAPSFHTAFDYIRENEGALYKQIEELQYEVRDLKERLMWAEGQTTLMNERDVMTNKLIDDLDNEIDEHMKIYLNAKEFAGRVVAYAMEYGLTIPLRKQDKQVIDKETLQRIESCSIHVKKKLKDIRDAQQRESKIDFETFMTQTKQNKKVEPSEPFQFEPKYTGALKNVLGNNDDKLLDPIYIYCIKHDHRSVYHKWVVHDMGEEYKENLGYSTILSDAPFEQIDRHHMVAIGAIYRKSPPQPSDDAHTECGAEYYSLPTIGILQRFASVSKCKANHFHRADGGGYVVFTTTTHPKIIEKELCYMLKPIISHKTYGSNTTKSFDNWITELTPIHTRIY